MKLITYKYNDNEFIGILSTDLLAVYPLSQMGINAATMNELIDTVTIEKLKEITADLSKHKCVPCSDITLLSPIPNPKQDIICLGINYMAHAVESARYKEEAFGGERPYAVYFSKRVNEAVPHNGIIPAYTQLVNSLDYEVELAVVIGKDAKNVSEKDAFDYVFGYTILNDISARNLQTQHKQWYFGKSLDGFTPIGPCIATADEFNNPPILKIQSYVNGELRQDSTTDLLIFDIPHVIHELSQGITLKAGTIISMGTPAGVGMGFTPPNFLKIGDKVDCVIEGIGTLTNIIG